MSLLWSLGSDRAPSIIHYLRNKIKIYVIKFLLRTDPLDPPPLETRHMAKKKFPRWGMTNHPRKEYTPSLGGDGPERGVARTGHLRQVWPRRQGPGQRAATGQPNSGPGLEKEVVGNESRRCYGMSDRRRCLGGRSNPAAAVRRSFGGSRRRDGGAWPGSDSHIQYHSHSETRPGLIGSGEPGFGTAVRGDGQPPGPCSACRGVVYCCHTGKRFSTTQEGRAWTSRCTVDTATRTLSRPWP